METQPSDLVSSLLSDDTPTPAQTPEVARPDPVQDQVEVPAITPDPPAPDEPVKPASLKDYAADKGLDMDELYGLELSSGTTLSELSNKGKELGQLDVDKTAHAGEVATFRAEQLRFNQAVQDWAALVQAGENTPDALVKLNEHRAVEAKARETQLLAAIPEWSDLTAKTADLARIDAFAGRFGLPAGTAENITEPGVALMMRYVLTLEDNFKAALDKVEKAKVKTFKPSSKSPPKKADLSGLNDAAQAMAQGLAKGR